MDNADVLDDAALALTKAGIDPSLIRRVLDDVRKRWIGQVYIRQRGCLTEDEMRHALESGKPLREVARNIGVSERTVRRRRSRWFE